VALFLSAVPIIPDVPPLLLGVLIVAASSACVTGREDAVVNTIWAAGMSTGAVFMANTPDRANPSTCLFGSILRISTRGLPLLAVSRRVVTALARRIHQQITAPSLDEEFARLRHDTRCARWHTERGRAASLVDFSLPTWITALAALMVLSPSAKAGRRLRDFYAALRRVLQGVSSLRAGRGLSVPAGRGGRC
jgi:hypothetical protein